MKILVTGASGLLGKALITELQINGHEVFALVRNPSKISELDRKNIYKWDESQLPPTESLRGKDAVINLVGEGIADKLWTEKRKRKLRDSRLVNTSNLTNAIKSLSPTDRPKTLISASAIGIYGHSQEKMFDEAWPTGTGFLAELCAEWEAAANLDSSLNIRVVNMRLGIILSKNGGFLSKMAPVILGSGQQWTSWVHISDVVRFVQEALVNPNFQGPYNITSSSPVKNTDLTQIYAKKMGFPFVARVPKTLLKLVLGEMSTAILSSQRVLPNRLLRTGFKFQYNQFNEAIDDIYGNDNFLDNYHTVNQFIAATKEKVFHFFSLAENLELITPPWLNFKITKKSADEITENILIDYKLKIHGVPVKWRTKISSWRPDDQFVDDQLKGPYTKWHHVHLFYKVAGGTLIRDEVTFRVPGSFIGKLFLTALIRKDVNTIFSYRQKVINDLQQSGKLD